MAFPSADRRATSPLFAWRDGRTGAFWSPASERHSVRAMTTSGDLSGKTALITGGSRGIGLGIARRFTGAGASVMLAARKPDGLEAAAAELVASGVPAERVAWQAGNVGRPEDAEACVAATIARFGAIDVLVNNAATNPYAGPDHRLRRVALGQDARGEPARAARVDAGGVAGRHEGARRLGDQHLFRRRVRHERGAGTYNVFKSALVHMTKQLAAELAPKVRVNCLARRADQDRLRRVALGTKAAATSSPRAIRSVASGETRRHRRRPRCTSPPGQSWVTGQTLVLDGRRPHPLRRLQRAK